VNQSDFTQGFSPASVIVLAKRRVPSSIRRKSSKRRLFICVHWHTVWERHCVELDIANRAFIPEAVAPTDADGFESMKKHAPLVSPPIDNVAFAVGQLAVFQGASDEHI
jgi:hypothetical protein